MTTIGDGGFAIGVRMTRHTGDRDHARRSRGANGYGDLAVTERVSVGNLNASTGVARLTLMIENKHERTAETTKSGKQGTSREVIAMAHVRPDVRQGWDADRDADEPWICRGRD